MVEITFIQMIIFISAVWILLRLFFVLKNRTFSIRRELQLLLVYICIVVIARFVFFALHHVNGQIDTLKIDFSKIGPDSVNLKPFMFISDIYEGSLVNIIGNITMFIPVGIVWPFCFKKLDNVLKVILAGAGYSLLIELLQLLFYERHSDVDDLILNTLGTAIGAIIYFVVRLLIKKKQKT